MKHKYSSKYLNKKQLNFKGEIMKILITGASSGIGRDMAKELDMSGNNLVLVARDEEKLKEVQKELKCEVSIIPMNLSNQDNCKKLHDMVRDVDILINNAGFGLFGDFTQTDLDKEIDMINTNITALHILTKLYLKDMKEKNKGYILNVASIAGFMPGPLMATYYATKSYVVRLTQAIKEELKKGKSNVKVGLLCPGPVATNFLKAAGVKFDLITRSSKHVAKYTINKMLKNKFFIIPGWDVKFGIRCSKLVPDFLLAKIAYSVQERRR